MSLVTAGPGHVEVVLSALIQRDEQVGAEVPPVNRQLRCVHLLLRGCNPSRHGALLKTRTRHKKQDRSDRRALESANRPVDAQVSQTLLLSALQPRQVVEGIGRAGRASRAEPRGALLPMDEGVLTATVLAGVGAGGRPGRRGCRHRAARGAGGR